jgi:hypothetical protein
MQIREETKAHFYNCEKTVVEEYERKKKNQGYSTKIEMAHPNGYVVICSIWIYVQESRNIKL